MIFWAISMIISFVFLGIMPSGIFRGILALWMILSFAGFIASLLELTMKLTFKDIKEKWRGE